MIICETAYAQDSPLIFSQVWFARCDGPCGYESERFATRTSAEGAAGSWHRNLFSDDLLCDDCYDDATGATWEGGDEW